ncbi:MAG: hypothetical protein H7346_24210, partial [Burkholderiaceae bacterium]|nr:hypothetical protein [Burkholderiaceae bacterium]
MWVGVGTGLALGAGSLLVLKLGNYLGLAAGDTIADALTLPEGSTQRKIVRGMSWGLTTGVSLATLAVLAGTSENPLEGFGTAITWIGTEGARFVGQPTRDYLNQATSGLVPVMTPRDKNGLAIGDSPDYAKYHAIRMCILIPTYTAGTLWMQTSGKQLVTQALGFGHEDLQSFASILRASVGPVLLSGAWEGEDAIMGVISHCVAAYMIGGRIEWGAATGEFSERANPLGNDGRNWAEVRANGSMRVFFFGLVDMFLALADRPGTDSATQLQLRAAAGLIHGFSEIPALVAQRGLRIVLAAIGAAIKALSEAKATAKQEAVNELSTKLEALVEKSRLDPENIDDPEVQQAIADIGELINKEIAETSRLRQEAVNAAKVTNPDSQNFREFDPAAQSVIAPPTKLPTVEEAENSASERIHSALTQDPLLSDPMSGVLPVITYLRIPQSPSSKSRSNRSPRFRSSPSSSSSAIAASSSSSSSSSSPSSASTLKPEVSILVTLAEESDEEDGISDLSL